MDLCTAAAAQASQQQVTATFGALSPSIAGGQQPGQQWLMYWAAQDQAMIGTGAAPQADWAACAWLVGHGGSSVGQQQAVFGRDLPLQT